MKNSEIKSDNFEEESIKEESIKNKKTINNDDIESFNEDSISDSLSKEKIKKPKKIKKTYPKIKEIKILSEKDLILLNYDYKKFSIKDLMKYHENLYKTIKEINIKLTKLIKEKSIKHLINSNKIKVFEEKPIEDQIKVFNYEIEINNKYLENFKKENKKINSYINKYNSNEFYSNLVNKTTKINKKIEKIKKEIIHLKINKEEKKIVEFDNFEQDFKFNLKNIDIERKNKIKNKKEIEKHKNTIQKQIKYITKLENEIKKIKKNSELNYDIKKIRIYNELKNKINKINSDNHLLKKYYNNIIKKKKSEINFINHKNIEFNKRISEEQEIINDIMSLLNKNKTQVIKSKTEKNYKKKSFIIKTKKPNKKYYNLVDKEIQFN